MEKRKTPQDITDGFGPMHHRIFRVTLPTSFRKAKLALRELKKDLNVFCPTLIASFEKLSGEKDDLCVNDEFQVHITGPWNGPVRVTDVTDVSFSLVTLKGHLEAGEIFFKLLQDSSGATIFQIESIARSRDFLVDLMYDKIPIGKVAQSAMWVIFCKRFAKAATGLPEDEFMIDIETERFDEDRGLWQRI
ncbi:DUF1990 domain-containing protein [Bdellovibrio sp. SKB1291214]|uniref:DUF1990 family protein n=1 Tax=Bdellovibrio sp. SKB1291214 TaxID=1732569 RepID=UPI000B51A9D6|nr:DUF1990 family protein [Bdellovibrio sp. SKB1291214]UYL07702.1 DUF1990 domain-containing protein [Bdellovibrio sp. SKB1291214]